MSACICMSVVVVGGAAVAPTGGRDGWPRSLSIAAKTSRICSAIASSVARATSAREVARDRPEIAARARSFQCGAPRPANAGIDGHAAVAFDRLRQRGQRRHVVETEESGHPRRSLGRDGDVALERIGGARAPPPGDGRRQAAAGEHRRLGQRHQRGAGAVGRLHLARRADGMAEERGVGIAEHGVDRQARRQAAARREVTPKRRVGAHRDRQDLRRHAEQRAQLRVPCAGGDIEKLRARGIAVVGGVDGAAGEVEQQPGIDRAGAQLAGRGPFAGRRVLIQQPADLGGREHRIERQAGLGRQPPPRPPDCADGRCVSADRRHCHDTQGPTGCPLALSQRRTDSRWLEMPMAAISDVRPGACEAVGDGL